MIKFRKNMTEITLDDGVERTAEVEEIIDEVLVYQICHPVRVCKPDGKIRFSRVPVSQLKEYAQAFDPILVPVDDLTAVLYPVLGCSKEDITDSDIKEFLEYILDPIFISTDEDGELCVSP